MDGVVVGIWYTYWQKRSDGAGSRGVWRVQVGRRGMWSQEGWEGYKGVVEVGGRIPKLHNAGDILGMKSRYLLGFTHINSDQRSAAAGWE